MLDEMRAFAVVAEVGSLQRAAEHLLLTQSAVTRQIQRLEGELAVTLLDRRAKPPKLTPVGWMVLDRCRSILKSVADLKSSTSTDGEPSGTLRIGVGNALADEQMADRLRDLGRRFRRLAIQVKTDWTPALIDQASRGLLDVAVMPKRPEVILPRDLAGRILGVEPLVFVAGRDWKFPARVSLKRLAAHRWVLKPKGCGTRETLRHMLESEGLPFAIAAEVPDENMQLSLVARGLGIALVSNRCTRRHPHRNRIRLIQVEHAKPYLEIAIVRGNFLGCLISAVDALERNLVKQLTPNRRSLSSS